MLGLSSMMNTSLIILSSIQQKRKKLAKKETTRDKDNLNKIINIKGKCISIITNLP
jgi:hypothetical protein